MKVTFEGFLSSLFSTELVDRSGQPKKELSQVPPTSSSTTSSPIGVAVPHQILKQTFTPSGGVGKLRGINVAEQPKSNEETIDVYPTIHSLEPTNLNRGTPWAGQKVPKGYIEGVAKAAVLAESLPEVFTKKDIKELLPLAVRESRYHNDTAYGINQVDVNYKTPPPKNIMPLIEQATAIKKAELKSDNLGEIQALIKQRQLIEKDILSNRSWVSRADSYHNTTNIITKKLGLKQSEHQELTYDKTGNFIGKVDRYRAEPGDDYSTKAKYILAAFANKRVGEDRSGPSSKSFIGGGKEAAVRYNQQEEIDSAIQNHEKNKAFKEYFDSQIKYYKSKPN